MTFIYPSRQYAFRLLSGPWGIAIDINARIVLGPDDMPISERIAGRTLLHLPRAGLTGSDRSFLRAGVALMNDAIAVRHPVGEIMVDVLSVEYTPTDYQTEGMQAAIVGWLREELDVEIPAITAAFDALSNRYVFRYA
jgi:hypothetical protein